MGTTDMSRIRRAFLEGKQVLQDYESRIFLSDTEMNEVEEIRLYLWGLVSGMALKESGRYAESYSFDQKAPVFFQTFLENLDLYDPADQDPEEFFLPLFRETADLLSKETNNNTKQEK